MELSRVQFQGQDPMDGKEKGVEEMEERKRSRHVLTIG
jgi:hypothetical protein